MRDDPGTVDRVRRLAEELAVAHMGDRSTRVAFLERAIEAVNRLAQTIDDGGLRDALEVDTDAAILSVLGRVRNGTASKNAAAIDPLAAAKARGEQAKREIIAEQGEMLNEVEVAARLAVTVDDVNNRRQSGLLVALPLDDGSWGFPSWQFSEEGLLPGLEDVLRSLTAEGPWSRLLFLQSGDPYLNAQTPLALIRRGEIETVQRLAAAYHELVGT